MSEKQQMDERERQVHAVESAISDTKAILRQFAEWTPQLEQRLATLEARLQVLVGGQVGRISPRRRLDTALAFSDEKLADSRLNHFGQAHDEPSQVLVQCRTCSTFHATDDSCPVCTSRAADRPAISYVDDDSQVEKADRFDEAFDGSCS
jgi:rubrerythrin